MDVLLASKCTSCTARAYVGCRYVFLNRGKQFGGLICGVGSHMYRYGRLAIGQRVRLRVSVRLFGGLSDEGMSDAVFGLLDDNGGLRCGDLQPVFGGRVAAPGSSGLVRPRLRTRLDPLLVATLTANMEA